jgi:penicillin-binding protein 1A
MILIEKIKTILKPAKKKKKVRRPLRKRILRWSIGFIIFLVLYILSVDVNFLWLFGRSPKIKEIYNPKMEVTSELYSADGKLLGKYFKRNRTPVQYSDISPVLIKTLVATEDVRFYKHHGIDFRAIFSIIADNLRGNKRGGSTITQQLVKNLFRTRSDYSAGLLGYIPGVKTVISKTKEWICAWKIEHYYSKEQILTMYFNTVDFGHNTFGINTASRTFFNTTPDKLNYAQCAVLVGLLKAPTSYSPLVNKERCVKRRNVVFSLMERYNVISKQQYDSLVKVPLVTDVHFEDNYDGEAVYFRQSVAKYLQSWLKEHNLDLYSDGLRIYTTLDSRLQKYAEAAVTENTKMRQNEFNAHWAGRNPWINENGNEMPNFINGVVKSDELYKALKSKYGNNKDSINFYLNQPHRMTVFTYNGDKDTTFSHIDSLKYYLRFLRAGFVTMDPVTGYVTTWVGDIDFKYFKYDHVMQFKRQPGSVFKAFMYTAAMDKGLDPCSRFIDRPFTIKYVEKGVAKEWTPNNCTRRFSNNSMTLKFAFAKSVNTIAVQVADKVGTLAIIDYAHRCGIKSPLDTVPSIAFGTSDISLFELVNGYCPLVNGGYRVEPILVTRIEDRNGKVLAEFSPKTERVLSEETAFLMVKMLEGGLTEPHATVQALFQYRIFGYPIDWGGKTGTSQNYSDAWFVGVSPRLVGGSWIGGEHRCIHFRDKMGEAYRTALPVYGIFMEKVLRDTAFKKLMTRFPKPKFEVKRNYSCQTPDYEARQALDSLGGD